MVDSFIYRNVDKFETHLTKAHKHTVTHSNTAVSRYFHNILLTERITTAAFYKQKRARPIYNSY